MKVLSKLKVTLFLLVFISINATAQETTVEDTLPGAIEQLQSDNQIAKRFKVSGYIQTQYQKADTMGAATDFAGGAMPGNSNERFMVRRGRVKFTYDYDFAKYVLQVDVTEKGVGIKDAYGEFTDPLLHTFMLTTGAFNRNFGYELEYSSSSRETPERSRVYQTIFKDERDLGAKLTIQAPKGHELNFLKFDVGVYNGNALAVETDKYKDIIVRLSAKKTIFNELLTISGGASYYNGAVALPNLTYYEFVNGKYTATTFKSKNHAAGRNYYGFDGQIVINTILGVTKIRGEYMWGIQSGTESTSQSPNSNTFYAKTQTYTTTSVTDAATNKTTYTTVANATAYNDIYKRNFNGGYINISQSIGQSKHALVVKYDWYDPNTKIAGNQIGKGQTWNTVAKKSDYDATLGNTGNAADIMYTTIGLGWIYHWNSAVKISGYYDMVSNETTNNSSRIMSAADNTNGIKTLAKDRKDNIFTLRVQYKF